MANEELLFRISMLEQEAKKYENNINAVNEQLGEFEILRESLKKIENEILAGVGKGIYVKSEIKEKELYVNVGCGIIVKKTSEEAEKIIERQIKELSELKVRFIDQIEKLNAEMQRIFETSREAEKV